MAVLFGGDTVNRNRIKFVIEQDGTPGTTLTISNAAIVASAFEGPLRGQLLALFSAVYANQAAARTAILHGTAASVFIYGRNGAGPTWGVDVNIDGSGLATLVVVAQAAAGFAILEVVANHTIVR